MSFVIMCDMEFPREIVTSELHPRHKKKTIPLQFLTTGTYDTKVNTYK
jgi:hypothetical protein